MSSKKTAGRGRRRAYEFAFCCCERVAVGVLKPRPGWRIWGWRVVLLMMMLLLLLLLQWFDGRSGHLKPRAEWPLVA